MVFLEALPPLETGLFNYYSEFEGSIAVQKLGFCVQDWPGSIPKYFIENKKYYTLAKN